MKQKKFAFIIFCIILIVFKVNALVKSFIQFQNKDIELKSLNNKIFKEFTRIRQL